MIDPGGDHIHDSRPSAFADFVFLLLAVAATATGFLLLADIWLLIALAWT